MLGKVNILFGRVRTLVILLIMGGFSVVGLQGQNIIVPDTIRSCMADSVMVNVYPGVDTIEWFNGDTTQYIWIQESGSYTVSGWRFGLYKNETFYVYILPSGIIENDTSLSCGDTIVLRGSDVYYDYLWSPGDVMGDSVYVYPRITSNIYAVISNPDTSWKYCVDSVLVTVDQLIQVDTIIQSVIGCPGDSVAQVQVVPSGGFPPYSYVWPIEATALVEDSSYAYGLVDGDKIITISDTLNCSIDHPFVIKAHRLPELELSTKPTDTVYLQNPWVLFSYENITYDSLTVDTFLVDNQWWDFGDSTEASNFHSPSYPYKEAGPKTIILTFKTYLGCFSTDTIEIEVLPVKLVASAVITPNGDQWNQFFELFEDTGSGNDENPENPAYKSTGNVPIDLSKYYLSNTLVIFNRWGEKVYEVDNYDNDWEGDNLIDGTYFYVINCTGEYRTDVFKGSFMILGSGGSE